MTPAWGNLMEITYSIVFLPCSDIVKTEAFYAGLLKLPVKDRQGEKLVMFEAGGATWGFCEYADKRKPLSGSKGVCLSLNLESTDAVRAAYEKLKESCRVYKEPSLHPDFPVYSFFILDPDDYLVEFQFITK